MTVTIGSLDPTMLCATLDTWDTLGIVPLETTIVNTSGEAHVIESFPAPSPAPVPPPGPGPGPQPGPSPTRRLAEANADHAAIIARLVLAYQEGTPCERIAAEGFLDQYAKESKAMKHLLGLGR